MVMFAIIRDLIRYNIEFAIGLAILLLLIGAVILSFFSPYPAADIYVVPPDMPPDAEFWLGTTSSTRRSMRGSGAPDASFFQYRGFLANSMRTPGS